MAAKKNQRYPLRIQGYGSAGEGVARLEGQAVFVKGALRGELCQVHLLKVGKRAAWGRVEQVLEPSPGRQVCEGAFSFSRQTGRHNGAAPFFPPGLPPSG